MGKTSQIYQLRKEKISCTYYGLLVGTASSPYTNMIAYISRYGVLAVHKHDCLLWGVQRGRCTYYGLLVGTASSPYTNMITCLSVQRGRCTYYGLHLVTCKNNLSIFFDSRNVPTTG